MNGIPYAIDFCNPAPDADIHSVGQANFDWIVENAANFAIERALAHKDGGNNLTWGTFVRNAVEGLGADAHNTHSVSDAPNAEAKPKPTAKPAPKAESNPKAKAEKIIASVKDDLKKIEGIGPKIEEILNTAGIISYADLSNSGTDELKALLATGGKRYQIHNPSTWAQQARLAASGKWDELQKWQDELSGGKKK